MLAGGASDAVAVPWWYVELLRALATVLAVMLGVLVASGVWSRWGPAGDRDLAQTRHSALYLLLVVVGTCCSALALYALLDVAGVG